MSAYNKSVDAAIFKSEDEGPIGPVWMRRGGQQTPHEVNPTDGGPEWFTLRQANRIAKSLGLPLFEV